MRFLAPLVLAAALVGLLPRDARAVCALGVCSPPIFHRNPERGDNRRDRDSSDSSGPSGPSAFDGRSLTGYQDWSSAEGKPLSVPLPRKKIVTPTTRYAGSTPSPRVAQAAASLETAGSAARQEAQELLGRVAPGSPAELASKRLDQCIAQQQDFIAAIEADDEGRRVKGLGDAAWAMGTGCGIGSLGGFGGVTEKFEAAAQQAAQVAEAGKQLQAVETRLKALPDMTEQMARIEADLEAAVKTLPKAARTPLEPPPALETLAEAAPPPPAEVPPEVVEPAKKRKKSLLAEARALNGKAQAEELGSALKTAAEDARSSLKDAGAALAGGDAAAIAKTAQDLAVKAETLRELAQVRPESMSRKPAGTLTIESVPGEDGVVQVTEKVKGAKAFPSPGVRVAVDLPGGGQAQAVTDAQGRAAAPAEPQPSEDQVGALLEAGRVAEAAALVHPAQPTQRSLEAASRASRALASYDSAGARAAAAEAAAASPWWADGAWASAALIQKDASDPRSAREAAQAWREFSERFPDDPRASSARQAASSDEDAANGLETPADPVYEPYREVTYEPRSLDIPTPTLGSPNIYLDAVGGAAGKEVGEFHVLRFLMFSTHWKFGVGTTAFTYYRTPFSTVVRGKGLESAGVAVIFPLEFAFSPVNFKAFGNTVIAPQFYFSASPFGTLTSRSIALGQSNYTASVSDYGLKVPLGAFVGLRLGRLSITAPAGANSSTGLSWSRVEGAKTYAAVDLFLGGMFGVPKPL